MMYKALISFSGCNFSMAMGEERELPPSIAIDLLNAGYIEPVKEEASKEADEEASKEASEEKTKEEEPKKTQSKTTTKRKEKKS